MDKHARISRGSESNWCPKYQIYRYFGGKFFDSTCTSAYFWRKNIGPTNDPSRIYLVQGRTPLDSSSKNRLHLVLSWEYLPREKTKSKLVTKMFYKKGVYVEEEYLASKLKEISSLDANCMFNNLVTVYHESVSIIPKLTLTDKTFQQEKTQDGLIRILIG